MGTCLTCGQDWNGSGPTCNQCKQTRLLDDQNRILSGKPTRAQENINLIFAILKLGLILVALAIAWIVLKWIYDLVISILTAIWNGIVWVWNILTWPFRAIWHLAESFVSWVYNLVGVSGSPSTGGTLLAVAGFITVIAVIGYRILRSDAGKKFIEGVKERYNDNSK